MRYSLEKIHGVYNLKLVANVLGILHVTPYGDGFVLEGSIQAISDAVGVNVRAYIANHADFAIK